MENNLLYVLSKGDYPAEGNIIEDGKLIFEPKDAYFFFTYNADKNRWDLVNTSKYRGVFAGAKGELYSSMLRTEEYILDPGLADLRDGYLLAENTPLGGNSGIISELGLESSFADPIVKNINRIIPGISSGSGQDQFYPLQGQIINIFTYASDGPHTWPASTSGGSGFGDGLINVSKGSGSGGYGVTEFNTGSENDYSYDCFIAGTKILLSNNTYKNIENISIGDSVKSYNIETNEIEDKKVNYIYDTVHTGEKNDYTIIISFKDTENHNTFTNPYWVDNKGWCSYNPSETYKKYKIIVEQLEIGDVCLTYKDGALLKNKILDIKEVFDEIHTYNFHVDDNHNYFANDILVHNKHGESHGSGGGYSENDWHYYAEITFYPPNAIQDSNWQGASCIISKEGLDDWDKTIVYVENNGKFWIYLGGVSTQYPNPTLEYDNIADYFENNYINGTWTTPDLDDPDNSYGDGDTNAGNYLEVRTPNPHGFSVGDVVKITEVDYDEDIHYTSSHHHGNKWGSPFQYGLHREISFIKSDTEFRFMVPGQEAYFDIPEFDNTPTYLYEWWEELYNGNHPLYNGEYEAWPHNHHGTATAELQEEWMLLDKVGDINRDGVIDELDAELANLYTYIKIEGNIFEEKEGYYMSGFPYWNYVILVDETSDNNYHKLNVEWVYTREQNSGWFTYLLIKNEVYPNATDDFGWNQTSNYNQYNKIPAGSKLIINDDTLVLPGEYALYQLFNAAETHRFTFISKNFSFENQTVNKILSKIKIIYKNTPPSFHYMINNNDEWLIPIQQDLIIKDGTLSYKIPKEHKKVKSIKVKIASNNNEHSLDYDTEVDAFSIIYRERGNA